MDLFVVPTVGFDLLYGLVIVRLDRRDLIWINVTANPTAEWVARQITEAFPWDEAPYYLIRDRDRIYGSVVTRPGGSLGGFFGSVIADAWPWPARALPWPGRCWPAAASPLPATTPEASLASAAPRTASYPRRQQRLVLLQPLA